jgi:hypothetical protein
MAHRDRCQCADSESAFRALRKRIEERSRLTATRMTPERTWEPARGAGSLPPRRRAESFDEKIKENAQLGEAVASGRIDR